MEQKNQSSTVVQEVDEECCPSFHPEKWDVKTFQWDEKKFIKETVPTFFHIPLPPMIGKRVVRMMRLAEDSKSLDQDRENILLLFSDPTAFKSDMYLSVERVVPGAKNTTLSGTFLTKVFDGSPRSIPKFIKQMAKFLDEQGKKAKDYYVHYAYCPKCVKEAGHNYVVLFAEVRQ